MEKAKGRAGIYVRISSDPKGEALGVARQEADCRKLCQEHGWDVVEVFCDNDHSAFDPRKTRPAYQEMIKAIKARQIDCVVCWHPDRLHRQTRELNPFIDLVNQYGVRVATVVAGTYDLSTPSGRMNARVVGATAEYESEHKSERIRRKLQENAANGKAHGGSRPYGWYADDLGRGRYGTVKPEEAAVVSRAADMLLAGKSLKEIVRALNAEGHTTATGKPWRAVHVRDMLNSRVTPGSASMTARSLGLASGSRSSPRRPSGRSARSCRTRRVAPTLAVMVACTFSRRSPNAGYVVARWSSGRARAARGRTRPSASIAALVGKSAAIKPPLMIL